MQLPFYFVADPCYHYNNLSDANRKISYATPPASELCDSQLFEGWYRFVGAAGTKMPTTRVPAYRRGTDFPGWLDGAHPRVEDSEIRRKVCFSDRSTGCQYSKGIFVKNCGSYFIYKLQTPPCPSRYCGTDWIWSKIFKKYEDSIIDPQVHVLQGFWEVLFLWWFLISFIGFIRWWCPVNLQSKMIWISHFTKHQFRNNNHKQRITSERTSNKQKKKRIEKENAASEILDKQEH